MALGYCRQSHNTKKSFKNLICCTSRTVDFSSIRLHSRSRSLLAADLSLVWRAGIRCCWILLNRKKTTHLKLEKKSNEWHELNYVRLDSPFVIPYYFCSIKSSKKGRQKLHHLVKILSSFSLKIAGKGTKTAQNWCKSKVFMMLFGQPEWNCISN